MKTKRPVSLSDSNIYIGNYTSINDFHVRLAPGPHVIEDKNSEDADKILADNYSDAVWSNVEFVVDYSMRFTCHLFLISIFEVLFYFQFVSKDEDSGILATTNYYTDSIINSCVALNSTEVALLNFVLEKFVNSSQILGAGALASSGRQATNNSIYMLSLTYIGILGAVQVGLLGISVVNKFKIKWRHIILENLALVVFLGLYEFMFFETIITQYAAISPDEISAQFVRGLQQRCALLKN